MGEGKHTPGPWHRNISPATKYPTVFAGRNTHVAVVNTQLDAAEVEANCDLIAAAPELLEACETFAEWLRREEAGYPDVARRFDANGNTTPEGEKAWREWFYENLRLCDLSQVLVRKAIAKATGGAL